MANKIQIRRDTAANWTSANPTLSQGEQGYETDTGKLKIGNGSTAWTSLGYSFVGYTDSDVDTHLNTSTATTGEVLSWTGSDYDWIAAASGADLYAANESTPTAQPSATGANAIAIGDSSTSSGNQSVALGGSNASGLGAFAFGLSSTSSSTYSNAFQRSTASGQGSFAAGSNGLNQGSVAIGTGSMALATSYAFNDGSFAAAIANNTSSYGATGANSVAIGQLSKATAANSIAIGDTATSTTANQIALGGTTDTVKISGVYTLPTADGTNGQVLTTNGAGAVTFADAGGGSSTITVDSKTAAYTIVSGDVGKLISFSGGSYTASLTAAATLGNGFYVYIENNAANGQQTHVVTIDPDASETIDGRSTMPLRQGQRILIVCDGSNWKTVADFNRAIATNATTTFFNLPQATGDESVAIGLGSVASNTNTTAIGLGAEATGSYATSFGTGTEATAFGSVASGYNAVSAGSQSIALGVSRASGADSFAAAIASNTSSYGATGANSVAMGDRAISSGTSTIAIGKLSQSTSFGSTSIGEDSRATGNSATAIGKYARASGVGAAAFGAGAFSEQTVASGDYSLALGYSNTASGARSVVIGNHSAAATSGKLAYASGRFAATGDAQTGIYVLRSDTTDATAEALTADNSSAGTDDQIILPNNSAYSFSGTIIARQDAASGSNYASWEIKGALLRDATAASTVLGNGIVNKLYATAGASAWAVALTADTTNGGLKVEVTGAAATNIRWVATVNTSEVTYA